MDDEAPFEAARKMLGCKKHDLLNTLLTRRLAAGGVDSRAHESRDSSRRRRQRGSEMLVVPLNRQEAKGARDKLAQEVRGRIKERPRKNHFSKRKGRESWENFRARRARYRYLLQYGENFAV